MQLSRRQNKVPPTAAYTVNEVIVTFSMCAHTNYVLYQSGRTVYRGMSPNSHRKLTSPPPSTKRITLNLRDDPLPMSHEATPYEDTSDDDGEVLV